MSYENSQKIVDFYIKTIQVTLQYGLRFFSQQVGTFHTTVLSFFNINSAGQSDTYITSGYPIHVYILGLNRKCVYIFSRVNFQMNSKFEIPMLFHNLQLHTHPVREKYRYCAAISRPRTNIPRLI